MENNYDQLQEAFEKYGRHSLVPIDCLSQIIFYAKCGLQPKIVWETEGKNGKITCWYLKSESTEIYKKWIEYTKTRGTYGKKQW